MPPLPVNSVLGYIGVFLLFLGVILFLCGVDIIKVAQLSVKPGRRTWIMGIFLVAIGALCISPEVSRTKAVSQSVPKNIASESTIIVSSVSAQVGSCQNGDKAVDGIISGFPQNTCSEWVSNGELAGARIKLSFDTPYQINKVTLYDRPNPSDNILEATLRFSDGTEVHTGPLPNDGSAKNLSFDTKTVDWVELVIDRAQGDNTGLAEIEVYGWK